MPNPNPDSSADDSESFIDPNSPLFAEDILDVDPLVRAEHLGGRALVCISYEDYKDAERIAEEALELCPPEEALKVANLLCVRGISRHCQENYVEAKADFRSSATRIGEAPLGSADRMAERATGFVNHWTARNFLAFAASGSIQDHDVELSTAYDSLQLANIEFCAWKDLRANKDDLDNNDEDKPCKGKHKETRVNVALHANFPMLALAGALSSHPNAASDHELARLFQKFSTPPDQYFKDLVDAARELQTRRPGLWQRRVKKIQSKHLRYLFTYPRILPLPKW